MQFHFIHSYFDASFVDVVLCIWNAHPQLVHHPSNEKRFPLQSSPKSLSHQKLPAVPPFYQTSDIFSPWHLQKPVPRKMTHPKPFPFWSASTTNQNPQLVISDKMQKIREEKHFVTLLTYPLKNVRTTLWGNVKHVDWADLARK